MFVHWISCTLSIDDLRNEPSVWNAICRNDEETDEQALLSHIESSGTFPKNQLHIGAALEPFSCFATLIDYMVFVHIALPKYKEESHAEDFSNALRAVVEHTRPEYDYISMRPLMGLCFIS